MGFEFEERRENIYRSTKAEINMVGIVDGEEIFFILSWQKSTLKNCDFLQLESNNPEVKTMYKYYMVLVFLVFWREHILGILVIQMSGQMEKLNLEVGFEQMLGVSVGVGMRNAVRLHVQGSDRRLCFIFYLEKPLSC